MLGMGKGDLFILSNLGEINRRGGRKISEMQYLLWVVRVAVGPSLGEACVVGEFPFPPLKGQLRKRGKNGQIVLPMHFRPQQQLRSECSAFIWLDSRSFDASRQTDRLLLKDFVSLPGQESRFLPSHL